MNYNKNFNEWTAFKKILNEVNIQLYFKEREIWWVSFGVNVGIEIDGKGGNFERPAVVVKKYNKEHAWVVPLTSSKRIKEGAHVQIFHPDLGDNSLAVISQLKTVSGNRLMTMIGNLSIPQFIKIIKALEDALPKYKEDLG